MAMGALMPATIVSAELAEMVKAQPSDWCPPVLVDQAWVDAFTGVARDPNPVHKAGAKVPGFEGPILPALMGLAIANALIPGGIESVFPGYTILFREVGNYKPKRAMAVGREVQLRYRISEIGCDIGGVYATIEFDLRGAPPDQKLFGFGVLSFYLIKNEPLRSQEVSQAA
jgi:hypothetical protein